MLEKHQPDHEFVRKLEWQIVSEARRRGRPDAGLPSRARRVVVVAGLMLASMGIGGVTVALAFQTRANAQRDTLVAGVSQRIELSRQRLKTVRELEEQAERQVSLGLAKEEVAAKARFKKTEAEAQLRLLELELAEISFPNGCGLELRCPNRRWNWKRNSGATCANGWNLARPI